MPLESLTGDSSRGGQLLVDPSMMKMDGPPYPEKIMHRSRAKHWEGHAWSGEGGRESLPRYPDHQINPGNRYHSQFVLTSLRMLLKLSTEQPV